MPQSIGFWAWRRIDAPARRASADYATLWRRARRTLSPAAKTELEAAKAALDAARAARDVDAVPGACARLEAAMQRHLSAYERAGWLENVESMGYAVLVALVLRALVVEAFKIPSGSMIPTLAVGDQIFVNKFIYGPRVPFRNWRPMPWAAPKRGEVVVFVCPIEPHEDFIKRIVAVAGDEVSVRGGTLYLNGVPTRHRPVGSSAYWDKDSTGERWLSFEANGFAEALDGHNFVALQDGEMVRRAADFGPYVVPPGHVFVMGDNRDHSYDSRAWGPVPVDNILGRAMLVWWSWGQDGLRPSRLGTRIE